MIKYQYTRRMGLGRLEKVSNFVFGLAGHSGDEFRGCQLEKRQLKFARHGLKSLFYRKKTKYLREERLSTARRSMDQEALRWLNT